MPWKYNEYKALPLSMEENTIGGTTYYVDGKAYCFAYVRKHYHAVRALSNGATNDVEKLTDDMVDSVISKGLVSIDDSEEDNELPWYGIKVFDEEGNLIGQIGDRCKHYAGHGTDHTGTGRCRSHTLEEQAHISRSSRHSRKLKEELRRKIEAQQNRSDAMNLAGELAVQRALLEQMVEELYNEEVVEPGQLMNAATTIIRLADVVGKQVERINVIDSRNALTASQVLYIQAAIAELFTKYILEPDRRERAVMELASMLGTDNIDYAGIATYNPHQLASKQFDVK